MQTQLGKRCFSGALATAIGLAALGGSLIAADASFGNVPAAGLSCVAADGKVNGRGSTFQANQQNTLWAGFRDDFCGPTSNSPADVAADRMGIYNYPAAVSGSLTGSGSGLKAMNCRTDAYAGTDLPYNEAQLGGLNGTPGNATVGCNTLPAGFVQPFAPNTAPFPNAADAASPLMSFPTAGGAVAIAVNLQAADCGGTKPSGLQFTSAQMTYIQGGSAINWNDAKLTVNNPSLSACTGPITRVVRQDNSGTTGIFKNYLIRVDDARTGATCSSGATWTSFLGSPNTAWPSTGTCSPLAVPTGSGGPALITLLGTTHGGIGYADLSDEVTGVANSALLTANLQNGIKTASVSPGAGKGSNCDFSALTLPGFGSPDSVGLNTGDNWGSDNATVNGAGGAIDHVNATDLGTKYPICGLTFDLVYSNTGLGAGATPNPISALSANQRRNLYAFMTYILGSSAQGKLGTIYYAPIPPLWQTTITGGFQGAF